MAKTEEQEVNVEEQAKQQAGQQVRLRIDQRNLTAAYSNAFRTNATADEVIVDLGLNQIVPAGAGADGNRSVAAEMQFDITHRVILNYYTAKRLAITLGQIVRKHEERFGELKLNVTDRAKK